MKKILFAIFLLGAGFTASAQTEATTTTQWEIGKVLEITNTNFNAGERPVGVPVDYVI